MSARLYPGTGLDLRCGDCGYGIAARPRLPERCPMCGGESWGAAGRPRVTDEVWLALEGSPNELVPSSESGGLAALSQAGPAPTAVLPLASQA